MKGELYHLTHTTTYDYPSPVTVSHHLLRVIPRRLPRQFLLEHSLDLTAHIHANLKFDPTATTVSTPPLEVLERRRGVCQDFAHFEIACLRSLGLPARYVGGYLETIPPPGQSRLLGADAMHAWVSFFCPGIGWIDLDPTNDCLPSLRHITVAWGRDYSDASPIRGVLLGSGEHTLSGAVEVVPLGAVHVPVEGE